MWKSGLDVEKIASLKLVLNLEKCVIESAKAGYVDTPIASTAVEVKISQLLAFLLGRRECMQAYIARPPKTLNAPFKPC
jgi:hypothetical protein